MSEQHDTTEETHKYVIHILWTVTEEGHGHGHSLHHIHRGEASGPWNPKGYIDEYVKSKFPGWLPDATGPIGFMSPAIKAHSMSVLKVDAVDDAAWEEWLAETKRTRSAADKEREREADMFTIMALQKKWGLLDGEQECAEAQEG